MAEARSDGTQTDSSRPETIEELFHALESPLLNYAQRLAPHSDMAEDLVQEAFMRLHAQFAQVRTPRNWLYRTVHNLALNHRRKDSKIVPLPVAGSVPEPDRGQAEDQTDPQPLPDEQIARWEGVGLVR